MQGERGSKSRFAECEWMIRFTSIKGPSFTKLTPPASPI
jgi:hypothetical protein